MINLCRDACGFYQWEDNNMSNIGYRLAGAALAATFVCALCTAGNAQLVTRKDLTPAMALTIAQGALDACSKQGYRVSVHVVGRDGEVLVAVRGETPHTYENSMRKAYTSRTTRAPSGDMVKRVKENPQLPLLMLANITTAQGALPIKVGEDVIGAVGVSGAPGGDKDEACSKAGIDKVAGELK
jgi:uncharacterized protein GlcG (DUF336 family)